MFVSLIYVRHTLYLVLQVLSSRHTKQTSKNVADTTFKNVGERSTAKNYCPVSLLSVVSKVFEKLVNNRIVDHLGSCGLFSDFQYGFKSFSINCRSSDSCA